MKPRNFYWAAILMIAASNLGCATKTFPPLTDKQRQLVGKTLHWRVYAGATEDLGVDHAHCVFCGAQIMAERKPNIPNVEIDGYTTDDRLAWVCNRCFDTHNPRFRWIAVRPRTPWPTN